VATAANPGGNVSGCSNFVDSMGGKWLALLKEIVHDITSAAVIANPTTTPCHFVLASEAAAPRVDVKIGPGARSRHGELEAPINAQGRETPGALVVLPDVFASIRRELTIKLATRDRLPAIYPFRFFATSGGLMSYGVDPEEPFGKVSEYADRILRG